MAGTGAGQAVKGFIANASSTFNPRNGYPAQNPTTGFSALNEGFAGVIKGKLANNGPTLNYYCIDIRTNTSSGIGYESGSWNEANVPNVGYVARILSEYYPSVPTQPTGLTDNQRAAAVQAAIWYFSDRYVLNTTDPLHDVVADIANRAIAQGPVVQPPPPTLDITPAVDRGPAGQTVGPFVVNSGTVDSTVTATGATMYRDAAGTQPLPNGTTVPTGTFVWLRSSAPGTATLKATAAATYPSGNVYLYDGQDPALSAAQKLILSKQETVTATVQAQAVFQAPGTLTVTKNIAGAAAGSQGLVRIHVDCGAAAGTLPDFVIPGGARGTRSQDYTGLPAGAFCTVTETADGHTSAVTVTVTGSGQQVTVPVDGVARATLTNTYTAVPGSLVVRKTITGAAAGNQGAVTIAVGCNDGVARDPFVIAAGSPAGVQSRTYPNIPGGTICTVTETVTGENQATTVTVSGNNQQVTVPAGGTITADAIRDEYDNAPGSLTLTKTIAGPAAGQQGPVTITATCAGVVLQPVLEIPAGATGTQSQTYTGIPTPATCTLVEDPDGHTDTVAVTKARSGATVTIDPGETVTEAVTDTYVRIPGNLVVNKTITGGAAGSQGQVAIHTECDGVAQTPDFVIPAGTAPGTQQQTYENIPNGAVCTVTETADGSTPQVSVTTVGSPQDATIPVDGSATATLTDTYEFAPGELTVTKTVTGPAAGQQDAVLIRTFCEGQELTPALTIPAGATGDVSQTYSELPAGTECTVVETQDGKNTTTAVDVQGRLREVTVPAGGTATAQITDTYTPRPGALVVRKTITGEASPLRGPITIEVECDDAVTRDPFVIPAAGARSGEEIRIYSEIPAGTTCTVTETEDGSTRAATVTVQGSGQDLSIPAAGAVVADLTNTYDFAPGSLVIRKRINGPLAGQQGDITLRPVCDGVELPPFTIPAGTPPGTLSRAYTDIPAGAQCTGTEAPNGANAVAVPRITVTRALPVRILPGAATTGTVTNTYTAAAVALRVSKTIRGERAGDQGEIVISTRCGDTTLPDLVIPAGASAGTTTRTYDGMTPSEQCTIRETADGRTTELEVRATGSPQDVTVPVIGTQTAYLTNAYEDVAASGPSGAANTDSPLLPNTGAPANATWLLPIGAVSVCVGMLMLAMSRRRQN